jgi:hypothetical protein
MAELNENNRSSQEGDVLNLSTENCEVDVLNVSFQNISINDGKLLLLISFSFCIFTIN